MKPNIPFVGWNNIQKAHEIPNSIVNIINFYVYDVDDFLWYKKKPYKYYINIIMIKLNYHPTTKYSIKINFNFFCLSWFTHILKVFNI